MSAESDQVGYDYLYTRLVSGRDGFLLASRVVW